MTFLANKDMSAPGQTPANPGSDEEVLAGVLNALHHNSGVPQERVRVEVRHGHVVLSGVLAQEFERALAERVAKTSPGVVDVTNDISLES